MIYDVMSCRLGFSVKAMCGGKFDSVFCLEVLIDGVRRFIYLLFQMVWRRFSKVRFIIHIYFQGFLEGMEDGCMLIVNVLLVLSVQRVRRKECWWYEVQFYALILVYKSIIAIQELYTEGVVPKIFFYFEWYADLIADLIDSARFGIGLDLDMIFDNVANFEVLGWIEIRVMKFTMASAVYFDNIFKYLLRK